MTISAPIRLIVITDTPMPPDWSQQARYVWPIIKHIWKDELVIDPHLRSVTNTIPPFRYAERYVSFYMEDQACDDAPVYMVYVPSSKAITKLLNAMRKEYFIRLWPATSTQPPQTATEELSNFLFAMARNFNGKVINLSYTDDFVIYKVTSRTHLVFRDYFFRQVRKCFRPVN